MLRQSSFDEIYIGEGSNSQDTTIVASSAVKNIPIVIGITCHSFESISLPGREKCIHIDKIGSEVFGLLALLSTREVRFLTIIALVI